MLVYIVSFFMTLFFSLFAFNKKQPLQKKTKIQLLFAMLSAFPLFFISSFRYGVGNDYFAYANYFEHSLKIHYMEPGFDFLVQLIRGFTDQYVWMFIICSVIFFYFIYRAIYEQSINPTFSIFIFICAPYFFEFFSGMRQMIAVAIFLYSIKYIRQRKLIPYVLFNILGGLFHSSSFVFLPVYFLYNKRISLKVGLFLITIAIVFRNLIGKLLYVIISLTDYSKYFDSQFDTGHFGIVTLIVPLFIFLFAVLFYDSKRENESEYDKDYQFYCNLLFVQVLIVLVQDLAPLITRIGWGFGISQIILIPYAIQKMRSPKNKFYVTVFVCFLFLIYVSIMRFSGGGGTLLPFRWVFNY